MTPQQKRTTLKQHGWHRQDRTQNGQPTELWLNPKTGNLVTLQTAWKTHTKQSQPPQ